MTSWWPVAFLTDLDPERPTAVRVEDLPFVLFRASNGTWAALVDRCPHRSARLSDGRVTDGTVECLYHGWRFGGDGVCRHVPQLADGAPIPAGARASVAAVQEVDGILWIGPQGSDQGRLAPIAALERDGVHRIDFVMDLPYPHDALIENVLDFAHIHVAHDGVRGGGHRESAGPLAFEIEDRQEHGFRAQFASPSVDRSEDAKRTESAIASFDAPSLVHYETTFRDRDRVAGLALYAVPIDAGRCRLLYRAYGNHWPDRDRYRPRWREHLFQMHLLEQDMAVVLGQVETLRADGRPLRRQWLPLKTSDPLVLAYRRWVDAFPGPAGRDVGPIAGWASTPAQGEAPATSPVETGDRSRYALHTRNCGDCRAALARHGARARRATAAAVLFGLCTAATPWPWSVGPLFAALIMLTLRRDSLRVAVSLTVAQPVQGHSHD